MRDANDARRGREPEGGEDTLPLGIPPEDEAEHQDLSMSEDLGLHSLRDADAAGPGMTTTEDPDEVADVLPPADNR